MYESPIKLYMTEPTFTHLKEELTQFEYKYKYVINEDELYKALTYDRNQYNKGYQDGFMEGYEKAKKEIQ